MTCPPRPTSAIILAGGLGTRLRSAVADRPKPLAPIAGRPFLAHQLDHWIDQGIRRFVLSVGYLHQQIVDCFGSSYRGAAIDYAVESERLGTGGGFLLAAARLQPTHPFLLLNGDTWFDVDLGRLSAFATAADSDWCLSLFPTSDAERYLGLALGPGGAIGSLAPVPAGQPRLANGGVYWVHPRTLGSTGFAAGQGLSLETDYFAAALAAGQRFHGLACDGAFIDIGVPHDYHRAAGVIAARPLAPA